MKKNKAFTLVEVMIVLAIVGILVAIAVPGFLKARHISRLNAMGIEQKYHTLVDYDQAEALWGIYNSKIPKNITNKDLLQVTGEQVFADEGSFEAIPSNVENGKFRILTDDGQTYLTEKSPQYKDGWVRFLDSSDGKWKSLSNVKEVVEDYED